MKVNEVNLRRVIKKGVKVQLSQNVFHDDKGIILGFSKIPCTAPAARAGLLITWEASTHYNSLLIG